MMNPAKYIMIGGFLGAGKTTAILKLAARLHEQGRRVGLITNDQSFNLVDTARARAEGHAVQEVTGGCFCCQFDSLVKAARHLTAETAPDVFLAEPVGSCTDLQATVTYPLRQLYGNDYSVAPLSVMVDPIRCAAVLGVRAGKRFSDKVLYVYRKQLEEAEQIVVNKVDLVDAELRRDLQTALAEAYPRATLRWVSARTGEGLEAWLQELMSTQGRGDTRLAIDYDEYAEGEARLGWLNLQGRIQFARDTDGNDFLARVTARIRERLTHQAVEIAHLKLILSHPLGPDVASLSLTRNEEAPQFTHHLTDPIRQGDLVVNLRAEGDPEQLRQAVEQGLLELGEATVELREVAAFRPARPVPTHRIEPGDGN